MESIFWLDSIWRCYSIFCVLEHFEADFTRQNDHFKECLAAATKLHFLGNFFFWGLPKYKKEQFEGGSIIFFDFIPPLEPGYISYLRTLRNLEWMDWLPCFWSQGRVWIYSKYFILYNTFEIIKKEHSAGGGANKSEKQSLKMENTLN